jgi:hypothetical protein
VAPLLVSPALQLAAKLRVTELCGHADPPTRPSPLPSRQTLLIGVE